MGVSVQPEYSPDNPFAPKRKYSADNPFVTKRDTGDIVLPKTEPDDTSVAPRQATKPGFLVRAGGALAATASDLLHHPQHIVTEPVNAAFDALVTPVKGSESSGIGGRGGPATLPAGTVVSAENTPGAITPERQREAGVETLANIAAPSVAGRVGRLIAPAAGKVAGEVVGRVGTNAAAGAAMNPGDPLVGAVSGATTGEAFHHAVERGVNAAVPRDNIPAIRTMDGRVIADPESGIHVEIAQKNGIPFENVKDGGWVKDGQYTVGSAAFPSETQGEGYRARLRAELDDKHAANVAKAETPQLRLERRATPRDNAPVWTPEERDAFHAEQTERYNRADRLSKPESPAEVDQTFARGKSEPFPYQSAEDLADKAFNETIAIPRRKAQPNAVNPKYRLDSDADLLSRAGELSARIEDYSSGAHGPATWVRDATDLSAPVGGNTHVAGRMNQDRDLYAGAVAELKARGWSDSDISEGVDERAGLQYRHSGVGLEPETAKKVSDVVGSALYSPAAAIRESHPDLTAAGEAAISAPTNARHIGQVQTKWVTEGIDPKAADAFLPQLQLDRLNHLVARDPSLIHDSAFAKNLADLQSKVPQGFQDTPEFKQMAERYKNIVLSQTEPAAALAGLKPEQFAQLPNGYARLVPSENAPQGTYADYVGGTGPKQLPATRLTTAQSASGTGAYTNSLAETVTQDAMDKIVKARQNQFYQQLLKEGTILEDPKAAVPEGQSKIMFNDYGNVISDPAQAKITLAVPNDVAQYAKHVDKALNEKGPTTPAAVAAKGASRAAGGLALLANPAAATSHSLTLANTVGTVPDVGKPLKSLVGVVPGGTTAKGAFDIATVDRTAPETRALEQRLSRTGALRPEMRQPTEGFGKTLADMRKALGPLGKVLSPHEILFGEDGIDKRSRLALAEKYIQAADKRGIPVTDAALREFVVNHAGDYIKGNAGALANHLQDSNLALFARMGLTRLTNAAKSARGESGLPSTTRLQKAGDIASTLARGAVGYGVGLTALNYYLSGHSPLQNEPGHIADLEYKTDDQGKKHYIRGAVLNPLVSTAMRAGGESLVRGDPAGVARDATNAALSVGTSHPLVRGAIEAATGRQPYVERDGSFLKTVPAELASGDQVTGRLKAAARDATAAGQFLGNSGPEKNPGVPGGKALSYLAPPVTSVAAPGGEARTKAQSAKDWLDDRTMQVYRAAGDTKKQQEIIDQAVADAEKFNASNDEKVTIGMVNRDLRKAAAKANSGIRRPNRLVRPAER